MGGGKVKSHTGPCILQLTIPTFMVLGSFIAQYALGSLGHFVIFSSLTVYKETLNYTEHWVSRSLMGDLHAHLAIMVVTTNFYCFYVAITGQVCNMTFCRRDFPVGPSKWQSLEHAK